MGSKQRENIPKQGKSRRKLSSESIQSSAPSSISPYVSMESFESGQFTPTCSSFGSNVSISSDGTDGTDSSSDFSEADPEDKPLLKKMYSFCKIIMKKRSSGNNVSIIF